MNQLPIRQRTLTEKNIYCITEYATQLHQHKSKASAKNHKPYHEAQLSSTDHNVLKMCYMNFVAKFSQQL